MKRQRALCWGLGISLCVAALSFGSVSTAIANPSGEGELLEESIAFEIEREIPGEGGGQQPPAGDPNPGQGAGGEQQAGYGGGSPDQGGSSGGQIYAPRPNPHYCIAGEVEVEGECLEVMEEMCRVGNTLFGLDCFDDPAAPPQQPVDGQPISEDQPGGEEPLPVVTEQDFAELPIQAAAVGFEPELQGFGFLDRHTNIFAVAETQTLNQEMLGHQVEIRAIPAQHRFDYGDGTVRESYEAGGPLPDHDSAGYEVDKTDTQTATSHVYTETGVHPVVISTVYLGEYRIGGGAWIPIPGSTTISSSPGSADIWRISSRTVGGECESPDAWGCNGPVELEPGEEPPAVFEDRYDENGDWTG